MSGHVGCSTGEGVAEGMGITRATFHQHRRETQAHGKLAAALLEPGSQ